MNHYQKLLKQYKQPKKTTPDDFFMNNSINLDEEFSGNKTLLQNAIISQDDDIFNSIIKIKKEYATKPHDVNIVDKTPKKWTALHYSVSNGVVYGERMLKELLDLGANPNIEDSEGKIPLYMAVEMGASSLIEMLLNHGSNPNKGLLLHTALVSDKPEAFNLLLNKDIIDIELVDEEGNTALHLAGRFGFKNEADALINKAKAKDIIKKYINIQNKDGNTILHEAAEAGKYSEFGNIIHLEKLDKSIKNKQGKTAEDIDKDIRDKKNKEELNKEVNQIRKRNKEEEKFKDKIILGERSKKYREVKENKEVILTVPFYSKAWFKSFIVFLILMGIFYCFFSFYIRSKPEVLKRSH